MKVFAVHGRYLDGKKFVFHVGETEDCVDLTEQRAVQFVINEVPKVRVALTLVQK